MRRLSPWKGNKLGQKSGRPGPDPHPPRNGDKAQARQRINVEVRMGRRPHPNSIQCKDCGHVWKPGLTRHEYDHYLGYAAAHHTDVESVCTLCHAQRDSLKKKQSACVNGHPFTLENTIYRDGKKRRRTCRACQQVADRGRHDAEYWRNWRAKRKAKK